MEIDEEPVCQNAKQGHQDRANRDRTFMAINLDLYVVLHIPKGKVGNFTSKYWWYTT